jgi:Leucine-rich repeat (LRR) protein
MQCREDESYALLQFKEGFDINKLASMNPLSYPKTTSWNASKDCCSWDGIKCDKHTNRVIRVDLRSSQLYGKMDANSSLFHLEHLRNLDLSDNNFDYSQIPHTIGELSQLRYLNLSHSMFFGEIPTQISHLSKLLSLDLGLNIDVSSPSPRSSAVNLLKLKSSILRSIIQNSTKLETLQLSYVTISSTLPDTLTNLTSLQALSLYSSELHGEFPVGVFHLPKLKYLDLRYNHNLNGKLPEFQSSSLAQLELDDTGFYGTLPLSIGKLSSLKKLSISGCHFYGNIPSSLGNLTQLVYISLEYNKFRGDPSASLENRTKISELYVGYNEFTIETISWIGKFSSLIGLDISSINVGSEIPLFVANLTKLQYLSAQKSNMKGEIPSWIMNLTNLAYLNLAQNSLHGEIPNSLFRLENLERLSLCDNLLHGKVKLDMFLKFKKLSVLNLSFNKFSLMGGKSFFQCDRVSNPCLTIGFLQFG